MGLRERLSAHVLDWMMRGVNELRAPTLAAARGEVLEVGFGTGLNLTFYPPQVSRLVALDPNPNEGLPALAERLRAAPFPVERYALRADRVLPFDNESFDCVVTTWTLCSIPDPLRALAEMRRLLKPGGHYLFIEHGRAPTTRTAKWQDRLNPLWCRLTGGCNMNRSIDRLVVEAGFELASIERFRHGGPGLLAHMYRGVATTAVHSRAGIVNTLNRKNAASTLEQRSDSPTVPDARSFGTKSCHGQHELPASSRSRR